MGILDAPVALPTSTRENLPAARVAALRPIVAALANRDYAPADMVWWGTSMTEGGPLSGESGPTYRWRRWADKLQASLRNRLPLYQPVTGSIGFIPPFYNTFIPGGTLVNGKYAPEGVTYSGSLTGYGSGLGSRAVGLVTASDWIQFTFTGDAFDLFLSTHSTASAVAKITVDGVDEPNFTVSTQTLKSVRFRKTGLTVASHTVKVTWVSTGPVVVDGLMPYNGDRDKGIRVWEAGKGSAKIFDIGTVSTARPFQALSIIQPALVGIEWGYNEYFGNVGVATFKSNLSAFVAACAANVTTPPTFLFIIWPQPQHPNTPVDTYASYVQAIRDVAAATANGVVVDFSERWPSPTTNNTLGFFYTDSVHPSDKGAAYVADVLAGVIAPK